MKKHPVYFRSTCDKTVKIAKNDKISHFHVTGSKSHFLRRTLISGQSIFRPPEKTQNFVCWKFKKIIFFKKIFLFSHFSQKKRAFLPYSTRKNTKKRTFSCFLRKKHNFRHFCTFSVFYSLLAHYITHCCKKCEKMKIWKKWKCKIKNGREIFFDVLNLLSPRFRDFGKIEFTHFSSKNALFCTFWEKRHSNTACYFTLKNGSKKISGKSYTYGTNENSQKQGPSPKPYFFAKNAKK